MIMIMAIAMITHVPLSTPLTWSPRRWLIEEAILAKNDHLAEHNRSWLAARDIVALNLMSSPGSGKTTLLERTISELEHRPVHLCHRG